MSNTMEKTKLEEAKEKMESLAEWCRDNSITMCCGVTDIHNTHVSLVGAVTLQSHVAVCLLGSQQLSLNETIDNIKSGE